MSHPPSAAIRHCRGRRENGCAIAVVSMISDLPYAEVVERCNLAEIEEKKLGLPFPRLLRALKELTGGNWWCKSLCRSPLVSDIAVDADTLIWITRDPSTGIAHAILVEGEWIYDPALYGEWPRKHYPCADWNVLMLIGMASPRSAAEIRVSRRRALREDSERRWVPLGYVRKLRDRSDLEGEALRSLIRV